MGAGNVWSYAPIRTVTTHADMALVARGLGISPWLLLPFVTAASLLVHRSLFARLLPLARRTFLARGPVADTSRAVLTCYLYFGFFGAAAFDGSCFSASSTCGRDPFSTTRAPTAWRRRRSATRSATGSSSAAGWSTFMAGMLEPVAILNGATVRSLVVLDEVGRGTSTRDGLAIARASLEHLHDAVGCRTLFATHYHELADAAEAMAGARCMAMDAAAGRHGDVFATGWRPAKPAAPMGSGSRPWPACQPPSWHGSPPSWATRKASHACNKACQNKLGSR